ncbi:MAG: hypothetical protein SF123_00540 [Chloroflexota bacterium]|nr:hypothetical protein [Chloroflexota bacterium]
MKRLMFWMLGLLFGALLGALLVALFAPVTGTAFRQRLKAGYRETLDEAQRVSRERQAELEAQLARMQGKS